MTRLATSPNNNVPASESNVIALCAHLTDSHVQYLARWLKAGQRMGLCDADIVKVTGAPKVGAQRQVVIWVRESADPAYLIGPIGLRWIVTDAIRDNIIGEYKSFESALAAIRPVIEIQEKSVSADKSFLLQG